MQKKFKIGCLALVILGVIGIIGMIVGVSIQKWHDGPTQSIAFLNTADVVRSVTFERIEENGNLADVYTVDSEIKPGKELIERAAPGNYKVKVWNPDKSLYNSTDFEVKLKDPKKSEHLLYRFDLAMDKIYAVVNLNALYEGKSFAEYMSNAVGTRQEKLRIEKLYDGSAPFFVPETYTARTFVDINDEIPSEVKYGEIVYGLFAFPKDLPEDQINGALLAQISEKIK